MLSGHAQSLNIMCDLVQEHLKGSYWFPLFHDVSKTSSNCVLHGRGVQAFFPRRCLNIHLGFPEHSRNEAGLAFLDHHDLRFLVRFLKGIRPVEEVPEGHACQVDVFLIAQHFDLGTHNGEQLKVERPHRVVFYVYALLRPLPHILEQVHHQFFLGGEMIIDRALGYTGQCSQLIHAGAIHALFPESLSGSLLDALALHLTECKLLNLHAKTSQRQNVNYSVHLCKK